MNIYLAARFSKRHVVHDIGKALEALGHIIVSRWSCPDSDHLVPTGMSAQAADDERRRFAIEDLEDIDKADWVVSLMEEPRNNSRGGRHVEFGYALAKGKRLSVIGPQETVFHHLDEVEVYESPGAFIHAVTEEMQS